MKKNYTGARPTKKNVLAGYVLIQILHFDLILFKNSDEIKKKKKTLVTHCSGQCLASSSRLWMSDCPSNMVH